MRGAPGLSQHKFGGRPTVGDLWAASSPPALVKSARANLPTPPVWLLLTQAGFEEKYSFLPRQIRNNKAPAPKGAQPPPSPCLPRCLSCTLSPSVCLSALPGCGRRLCTPGCFSCLSSPSGGLLVITSLCSIFLLSVQMDCAAGLICRIVRELKMAFG